MGPVRGKGKPIVVCGAVLVTVLVQNGIGLCLVDEIELGRHLLCGDGRTTGSFRQMNCSQNICGGVLGASPLLCQVIPHRSHADIEPNNPAGDETQTSPITYFHENLLVLAQNETEVDTIEIVGK